MFFECVFLILLFILYFFIYVDMKINKNNELYLFDSEFTKTNLNKEICLKLPFYFDGQHIRDTYEKSSLTKVRKVKHHYDLYTKPYDSIPLLEPPLRFKSWQDIYYIPKLKTLPLLIDNCSINYYRIQKGCCKVVLIHPKFKEHFISEDGKLSSSSSKLEFIRNNPHMKCMVCYENTILYVPNQWIVYVENMEKKTSILEIIHYSTLCNQLIRWVKKDLSTNQIES